MKIELIMPIKNPFLIILIFGLLLSSIASDFSVKTINVLGASINPEIDLIASDLTLPSLREFSEKVRNGRFDFPTGVFIPGNLALPIVQQPSSDSAFVSKEHETLTQLRSASQFRTIGLLAHDYLAGKQFSQLLIGQDVVIVYGDGSMRFYRIYEIQKYQALTPTSPSSSFVDLSNNKTMSAEMLFNRTYGLGNILIFQTCISTKQVPSWGRMFILARPVENLTLSVAQFVPIIEKVFASANRALKTNR